MKRHVEFLGELDAARVHDARSDAGQLQHLVVADEIHLARFGNHARIGGVDTVHVGVNFAADFAVVSIRVMLHDSGEGDGGRVRAAAAQGGDVVIRVDPLEARDNNDSAFVQSLPHALRGDVLDAGFGVITVGHDADLGAGEADGRLTQRLNGHGHERNGNLLAGGQEHVHLTGRRLVADLAGQGDEFISRVAASADDDDDLVVGLLGPERTSSRRHDALGRRHAGAAEFLYD